MRGRARPSCIDPANEDEDGHGTHVAGTIASPLNGVGIAGVAPNVTLVNLRAGQDSGYFFLQPTVDALTYAGDNGVDVVNMSYFIDPWLYNCAANPADSPAEQAEQRTIVEATQRALNYAHRHGVTLVAAAGNEHTDIGHPTSTTPARTSRRAPSTPATSTTRCLTMPTEGRHVIVVSSIGPSTTKADYSNYGAEHIDVTAPGRLTSATLRHAAVPHRGNADPRGRTRRTSLAIERRRSNPDGDAEHAVRRPQDCKGGDLRVLPVPPGHLDGVAARRRRGRADRRPLRASRPPGREGVVPRVRRGTTPARPGGRGCPKRLTISAATPAACGDAIEVPWRYW